MESDWKPRLIELIAEHAILRGEFTLRSGKTSSYYIDGRMITLHPEGARLIALGILDRIADDSIDAVGGPEMGAVPMVGAVCAMSNEMAVTWEEEGLRGFVFRKEVKDHGTMKQIEGPLRAGDRVVVIEDTTTTGGQVVKCIQACREMGCEVVKVITVIDREDAARANIETEGCRFEPLTSSADFGLSREE